MGLCLGSQGGSRGFFFPVGEVPLYPLARTARSVSLQGYLAHKKTHPPPRTIAGPLAEAYCRLLGGCDFYERGTPASGGDLYHYQYGRHVCVCTPATAASEQDLQGYLAHEKPRPPLGPP